MDFEKIVEDIDQLPSNGLEAWVRIAEKAYLETILDNQDTDDNSMILSNVNQLVDFLSQLAKRLKVTQPNPPSLKFSSALGDAGSLMTYLDEYINRQVSVLIAEKVARKLDDDQITTVDNIEVSNAGIVKIHTLLGDLRRTVDGAELPDKRKEKLHAKLNEFERELVSRSVSGTRLFAVLALVGAAIAGTTSAVADGPDALETIGRITAYLGIEKQNQEEAAQIAAEAETLALTAPTNDGHAQNRGTPDGD